MIAECAWTALRAEGHFKQEAVRSFLTFPFDRRVIYYVDRLKWLNEARSELADNADGNEFLITVPEPRKESESRPIYTTALPNLHVHERGSVAFPREAKEGFSPERYANINEAVWRALSSHFGLSGTRANADARAFVGR